MAIILNKKVLVICGKTACGKTTIAKRIAEKYSEVKSYTTRPKRKGETDEYVFVTKEEFDKMELENKFINVRDYHTEYGLWRYGTPLEVLLNSDNPMLILDEQGLENIQNKLGRENVISILIEADETTRLIRSLNRDEATEQNTREIKRRIKDDDIKFKNRSLYDYILMNNSLVELERNIKFILSLELK